MDVDYGLEFYCDLIPNTTTYSRYVKVIEGGVRQDFPTFFSPSDVFKIVYDNPTGKTSYYKNGVVLPPMIWPIPPPTPWPLQYFSTTPLNNYVVDAVLGENGEGITMANTSFGCPTSEYPVLKKKLDAGFYISVANKLKFQYLEEYSVANTNLDINIFESDLTPIASIPSTLISKIGANYYEMDLSTLTGFVSGKYYVLEIDNTKNEKFKLRFLYQ